MNTFYWLNIIWIVLGLATFIYLMISRVRAPYGRHSSKAWGPMVDNQWGWFWMELPAFLVCPLLAFLGPNDLSAHSYLLVSLWMLHYFNRVFVFPLRIKTKGKKMPVLIVASAAFFNLINGALNGYFLGFIEVPNWSVWSLHSIVGISLFFMGMAINIHTDNRLIALRKEQAGYQIPRGWLFEYISCPNHFGEILEWIGFAILAWNLPALSFAIWTFCNLVPRAFNHHSWYQEYFADYPERNAVFPFLF